MALTNADVDGSLEVHINTGGAIFGTGRSYNVGNTPIAISAAQIDGATDIDLIAAKDGSNDLTLLFNDGTSQFSIQERYLSGGDMDDLTLADFDQDGDVDDGLPDVIENSACADINDADTDDDGPSDSTENANRNVRLDPGETNPCLLYMDGNRIHVGIESGVTQAINDPYATDPLGGLIPAVLSETRIQRPPQISEGQTPTRIAYETGRRR